MSDGRETFGLTTENIHCDKCRKKALVFYESIYYWKGSICGSCKKEVSNEIKVKNGQYWCNFLEDQGEPIDRWCDSPEF